MNSSKFLIALLSVLFIAKITNAQTQENFLKHYKAPEFSLSSLDFEEEISSSNYRIGVTTEKTFSNVLDLNYQFYKNSDSYQGSLTGRFANSVRLRTVAPDFGPGSKYLTNTLSFRAISNNYFYLKSDKRFLSAHGGILEVYNYTNDNETKAIYNSFHFNPAIGVGKGRLEPVHYARSAMDMQLILNRNSAISRDYTVQELKQIADKIAEINNVRFYDFRLRRIVQLEELDQELFEIGNVSERNVRYFAAMADAYLYSKVFPRFSGLRNEFGITGGFARKLGVAGEGIASTQKRLFAYYKFDLHLPQNYYLQHNVKAIVISGVQKQTVENFPTATIINPIFVNATYEFSIYPTTRTNFRFGVESFMAAPLSDDFFDVFGVKLGLFTEGDIYITPRIRAFYKVAYVTGTENTWPLDNLDHLYLLNNSMYWPSKYRFSMKAGFSIAVF